MSDGSPLVETRQVGPWRVHAIQTGAIKLDGGAMFGVVPKTLWQRRMPADDRNRISMCMRCLLVEHDIGLVLIDSGAGNKEDAKFHDIYAIENAGADGRTKLEDGVRAAGHSLEDVALVINTHLHFDHAGGNTFVDAGGAVRPSFPRARYVVQRGEYRFATHTNERTSGSYFPRNFVPLHEAGLFDLVDGDREIVRGIRVITSPGHVPHHQSVLIGAGGNELLFLADVVPTSAHLPLPWIMGYDVEPLVTLESKRRILRQAVEEGWAVCFEHDASVSWGTLVWDGKTHALAP
ncbi:MAG TPA: MBL fold metallo-hydrolase [Gemmatimonadaceae bacterium]|nr:MBL fold metallo-hydrolase [Gemmatimonadaceae bacterium]